MSTEQSNSRKLNVQPATDAELFAQFNTNTTEGDTEEAQQQAYEQYQDAYSQQLETEEKARDNRTRNTSLRKFGFIAGGTLGVGALAMAGANMLGNAKTEKDPTTSSETTDSASLVPGVGETSAPTGEATPSPYNSPANTEALKTEKPVVSDPSLRHESVIQHDLYSTLTPEVQEKIDRIASLTPEQVAAMPVEEQLLFASFVRDNNEAHAKWRLQTNGSAAYKRVIEAAASSTATDTGEEILAQGDLNAQIIFTLMPKGKTLDRATAQKLTILNISPESKGYENYNDIIESNTGGILKPSAVSALAERSYESNGVQYKILNLTDGKGGVTQNKLRLQEFTDYTGKTRATWQTILDIDSSDPRFDNSLTK